MFTNLEQACVRRRAILSVRANPMCPDEAAAERAVNEVWESCFGDTRPFDEVSCARLVASRRGGAVHF
jgi:inner membrane protease ATP23